MRMTHNLQQHATRFLAYSSRNRFFCSYTNGALSSPASNLTLQGRIVAALDRKSEITTVLEQWRQQQQQQQQENQLNPSLVRGIVDKLRDSQRFREALEVSEWMIEKKICNLVPEDFTARFHLIENVLGLEKAEKFFESIPENLKSESIYNSLLSTYARRSENKAESIFKKMRELGLLLRPSPYNSMISFYSSLGNRDKVDEILQEMKESKTDELDNLTMNNVLRLYADVNDVETMDKYKREWDGNGNGNDNKLKLEERTMDAMANAYEKAGLLREAIEITTCKKQVYRLWNEYKEKAKTEINYAEAFSSESYRIVISSLLKLDDVKGAEEVYEEWEPRGPEFDSRIPCLLISRYSKEDDEVKVREIVNSSRQKQKWMKFEMFKDTLILNGIMCAGVALFGMAIIMVFMLDTFSFTLFCAIVLCFLASGG